MRLKNKPLEQNKIIFAYIPHECDVCHDIIWWEWVMKFVEDMGETVWNHYYCSNCRQFKTENFR